MHNLVQEIDNLKTSGLYRSLSLPMGLDFSSNDYLGLAQSNFLKEDLKKFIEEEKYRWPCSSRLISGSTALHLKAEQELAEFLERPASLLFNSGYNANVGVISTLCQNSLLFSDQLNHSSLIEGIKLSRSPCQIYPHNNLKALEKLLQNQSQQTIDKYIITESVFSMDGSQPDLKEMLKLANNFGAKVIIDEAHATGIFGGRGQGRLAENSFDQDQVISIHTGGKALGAYGAFIGCNQTVKKILINKCKHFIYTTALPPLNVYILMRSIEYCSDHPRLRKQLFENIKHVHLQLKKTKAPCLPTPSPIISLPCPGNEQALKVSDNLAQEKIYVKAIRYPTVPRGQERLRLSIHSNHSKKDLDYVVKSFEKIKNKEKAWPWEITL